MRWLDGEDLYYLAVVALIRGAAWSRSPRVADTLANGVARIAWLLPTAKRRQVVARITAVLDPMSATQLRFIAQGTYRAFWQDAFALAGTVQPSDAQRLRVDGLDHLRRALAQG